MQKLNRKGFSSLELFGVILVMVIVIVGVVTMLSKSSDIQRYNKFLKLAKTYGNEVATKYSNDDITCSYNSSTLMSSLLPNDKFSVLISNDKNDVSGELKTAYDNAIKLVKEGGKSPWGEGKIRGYVTMDLTNMDSKVFSVQLIDDSGHAIIYKPDKPLSFKNLSTKSIVEDNYTLENAFDNSPKNRCTVD